MKLSNNEINAIANPKELKCPTREKIRDKIIISNIGSDTDIENLTKSVVTFFMPKK